MRPLIDKAHAVTGHPPRVVAEANTRFLLKELVLRGHGWTVLPAVSIARDVAAGVLSGAPLVDPDITRGIVLAFQRARRIPTTVEAVASEIRSLVRETVQMGRWAGARLHEEGTGGVNPGPHRPQRGDTSGSVDTTPDGL